MGEQKGRAAGTTLESLRSSSWVHDFQQITTESLRSSTHVHSFPQITTESLRSSTRVQSFPWRTIESLCHCNSWTQPCTKHIHITGLEEAAATRQLCPCTKRAYNWRLADGSAFEEMWSHSSWRRCGRCAGTSRTMSPMSNLAAVFMHASVLWRLRVARLWCGKDSTAGFRYGDFWDRFRCILPMTGSWWLRDRRGRSCLLVCWEVLHIEHCICIRWGLVLLHLVNVQRALGVWGGDTMNIARSNVLICRNADCSRPLQRCKRGISHAAWEIEEHVPLVYEEQECNNQNGNNHEDSEDVELGRRMEALPSLLFKWGKLLAVVVCDVRIVLARTRSIEADCSRIEWTGLCWGATVTYQGLRLAFNPAIYNGRFVPFSTHASTIHTNHMSADMVIAVPIISAALSKFIHPYRTFQLQGSIRASYRDEASGDAHNHKGHVVARAIAGSWLYGDGGVRLPVYKEEMC